MEESSIYLNGGKVFLLQENTHESETILLLHGMSFSSDNWTQIDALRKISQWGYRVIAIDYPGFGNSTENAFYDISGADYTVSSSFIRDLCTELRLNRIIVLGPSMGGAIAIRASIDLPELVEKVIAVAPAGFAALKPELYRINCPIHLIWGTEDSTIDISYGRRYHDHIAGSSLHVIKGGKHALYLNKTAQFFSLLKNLLFDEC